MRRTFEIANTSVNRQDLAILLLGMVTLIEETCLVPSCILWFVHRLEGISIL